MSSTLIETGKMKTHLKDGNNAIILYLTISKLFYEQVKTLLILLFLILPIHPKSTIC